MGELEDWINSDNAWIDVTAISVRIPSTFRFWELIPQVSSPQVHPQWGFPPLYWNWLTNQMAAD